jgi:hypothetical protein
VIKRAPNFVRLHPSLSDVAILVEAMLRARDVVAARSWSAEPQRAGPNGRAKFSEGQGITFYTRIDALKGLTPYLCGAARCHQPIRDEASMESFGKPGERELIRARTGEGRKRAKERGVRFGRPPKLTSARKRCSGLPTARCRRTLRAPTQ